MLKEAWRGIKDIPNIVRKKGIEERSDYYSWDQLIDQKLALAEKEGLEARFEYKFKGSDAGYYFTIIKRLSEISFVFINVNLTFKENHQSAIVLFQGRDPREILQADENTQEESIGSLYKTLAEAKLYQPKSGRRWMGSAPRESAALKVLKEEVTL